MFNLAYLYVNSKLVVTVECLHIVHKAIVFEHGILVMLMQEYCNRLPYKISVAVHRPGAIKSVDSSLSIEWHPLCPRTRMSTSFCTIGASF
jgi:hypothetical protein